MMTLIHNLKGHFIVVLLTDTALDMSPKQLDRLEDNALCIHWNK